MGFLPGRVSAIVFDCDGLLLDTESCWSRAEASLFAEYGFGFGPEQKRILIGRSLESACANMADYIGRPGIGPELVAALLPKVEAELAAGVRAMRGARELVETLHGRVKLGVATNSRRSMLEVAMESAELAEFFSVTVAADEVSRPKPHPELYVRAFGLLSASPSSGVALEDSATGMAAARAAGAFVITVPSQPKDPVQGDHLAVALDDDDLVDWARRVRSL